MPTVTPGLHFADMGHFDSQQSALSHNPLHMQLSNKHDQTAVLKARQADKETELRMQVYNLDPLHPRIILISLQCI